MRPVIDYLDTIVFSSRGNDLFALFISVVWLSQLCAVCYCTSHSGMFSCRCWSTLNPVGPPEVHWAFIIVFVVEGYGGLRHVCSQLCSPHLTSTGAISVAQFVLLYICVVNL